VRCVLRPQVAALAALSLASPWPLGQAPRDCSWWGRTIVTPQHSSPSLEKECPSAPGANHVELDVAAPAATLVHQA
jgi:hypothetical protein